MKKISFICNHCVDNYSEIELIGYDNEGYFWFFCRKKEHLSEEINTFHLEHIFDNTYIHETLLKLIDRGFGYQAEFKNSTWELGKS